MAKALILDNHTAIKGMLFNGQHVQLSYNKESVYPLPPRNVKNYPYIGELPKDSIWDYEERIYYKVVNGKRYPLSLVGSYIEPYYIDINKTSRLIKKVNAAIEMYPDGVNGPDFIHANHHGNLRLPKGNSVDGNLHLEVLSVVPKRPIITFHTTDHWYPDDLKNDFYIDPVQQPKDSNPLLGGFFGRNRIINIEIKHKMLYRCKMHDLNGVEMSTTFEIFGDNNTINIYLDDTVEVMGMADSGSDHIYAFLYLTGRDNTINIWGQENYYNNFGYRLYSTFEHNPNEYRGANFKTLVYCQTGNTINNTNLGTYPYL